MDGQGSFFFPDGRIYIGNWKNNMMNGQGTLEYDNGKRYRGGFVDGFFEGFGQIYDTETHKTISGTFYRGQLQRKQ